MKYFDFTRREKISVIFLSVVILILTLALQYEPELDTPYSIEVDTTAIEYIPIPEDSLEDYNNYYSSYDESNEGNWSSDYFEFDPNVLDTSGWIKLGFSKKQANAIINYREKFGTFKSKEDLKKVYVITEEKYLELEPYIKIDKGNLNLIKINLATKEDLTTVHGIGNVFADRIIKYRNKLGGFVRVDQLKEVYGISDELYQDLKSEIEIDIENIKKIEINSASKSELKNHPYISFVMTAEILKMRESERISDLNFLVDKKLADQEEIDKIRPYIIF